MEALKEISCTLLPGKYASGVAVPGLYNHVYRYWRQVWGEIFTRAGSPASLNVENFLRQNVIIALHREEDVIGIVCACFFNLSAESTFDHAYLKTFPDETVRILRDQGSGLYTTYEYISIRPGFRKSEIGISLSDVLLGLCEKVFTFSDAKIALATAVRPAKIAEVLKIFGWIEVGSISKYGLDCVLLRSTPQGRRDHEDHAVSSLIEHYWKNKTDLAGLADQLEKTETNWVRRAA